MRLEVEDAERKLCARWRGAQKGARGERTYVVPERVGVESSEELFGFALQDCIGVQGDHHQSRKDFDEDAQVFSVGPEDRQDV